MCLPYNAQHGKSYSTVADLQPKSSGMHETLVTHGLIYVDGADAHSQQHFTGNHLALLTIIC